MAENTRFQRFKERVRKRVQGLGGWLTCIWTKVIAWGHRRADVGRMWMQKLQRQWSKIWQAVWNGKWKVGAQLQRHPVLWVVLVFVIIFSLWIIPKCQVAGATLNDKERLELEDKARGTLAQIIGGMAVLIGLYFTWRNAVAAWQTVQVNQEGQITERFTRAIDQLGATEEHGKKRLELRLGGIYALERIARDSEQDHWPIMEVLTAYVREHAPWQENSPPQQDQPSDSEALPSGEDISQQPDPQSQIKTDTDIQAIMTVLGRRTRWYRKGEDQSLDLRWTNIRGVYLRRAHLQGANLSGAHLQGAHLSGAHLQEANLIIAHLKEANLSGADLQGADLRNADLQGADLRDVHRLNEATLIGAHLERANLRGAHLQGANLRSVHLKEADLGGAHLKEADLRNADLQGAKLFKAKLQGATLIDAHLERAILIGADLERANLSGADLQGADLRAVLNLTPEQLESAGTTEGAILPDYL